MFSQVLGGMGRISLVPSPFLVSGPVYFPGGGRVSLVLCSFQLEEVGYFWSYVPSGLQPKSIIDVLCMQTLKRIIGLLCRLPRAWRFWLTAGTFRRPSGCGGSVTTDSSTRRRCGRSCWARCGMASTPATTSRSSAEPSSSRPQERYGDS